MSDKIAMSSTEEDSEMSYDSSCLGDSFIDAIEEENGISRMVIVGLTGLCVYVFERTPFSL